MKNLFPLFVLLVLLNSCTRRREQHTGNTKVNRTGGINSFDLQSKEDTLAITNKQEQPGTMDQVDSVETLTPPLTGDLPFGSEILMNTKFPKSWTIGEEAGKEDERIDDLFTKAYYYYSLLIRKEVDTTLHFNNIEYIRLNHPDHFIDSIINSANSIANSVDSIRYKLPHIGPYECYYSQIKGKYNGKPNATFEEEGLWCQEAGNLIFYDPETQNAKVINVYFDVEDDWISAYHRYFYIKEDKSIHIYDIHADETQMDFKYEFVINVDDSGKVNIQKL